MRSPQPGRRPARTVEEAVGACPADEEIVSEIAGQRVRPILAVERVVVRTAEHGIVAAAAMDQVPAAIAVDVPVRTRAAHHGIVALAAPHQIGTGSAADEVVAAIAVELVVAGIPVDRVRPVEAEDGIVAAQHEPVIPSGPPSIQSDAAVASFVAAQCRMVARYSSVIRRTPLAKGGRS